MHQKVDFILLIDDDEATRFLHRLMAEESGVTDNIFEAEGAEQGLGILKKIISEQPNSRGLIFLDINMPVMDGWSFLDAVSAVPTFPSPRIHIYMASSSEYPKDMERIENEPLVKGFVPKPLTAEKVLEDTRNM